MTTSPASPGPAAGRCVPSWPTTLRRRRRRRRLLMSDHDHLVAMLNRLKLTALRDQLDSLIDEAARQDLTIRDAAGAVLRARDCPSRSTADRHGLRVGPLPARA